jgi:hypothetical protein
VRSGTRPRRCPLGPCRATSASTPANATRRASTCVPSPRSRRAYSARCRRRSRSAGATPTNRTTATTTEFTIIGFRDGWFLIEGAKPPGKEYEPDRPLKFPKVYAGRGWVAANKVGASFANGATRGGGLFQAPHVDARWTRVPDRHGNEIGPDSSPDRILTCSGLWALVEKNGVRGWWRNLCSNQVTNCS